GFSTDVNRDYSTSKGRNTTPDDIIILPTFNKTFNMNRNYDLKWDLTKNLKMDFTANNIERVMEPDGEVTDATKDTLFKQFFERLTKTQYNHQVSLNYNIPINKIPLLDFTTASVRYAGTYSWQHSPLFDTDRDPDGEIINRIDTLGNTIQNSRNISWNGQLNMLTLYNKIPYLKRINQKSNKNKGGKTSAITSTKPGADSTKKKKDNFEILEYVARFVMTLKTVNITYSDNAGTMMPGYKRGTQMMGMDEHFQGPTVGFIFGSQQDIRNKAIASTEDGDPNNDWLVKTSSLNTPYTTTSSQSLNIRANAEPFPDLKVELTATRTQSKSTNEFFRWSDTDDGFVSDARTETGTFSMSFLTYKTSFKDGDETFTAFLNARPNVSARQGENPNSTTTINGYAEGYNAVSQDVLIPAFLAAYSGKNPNGIGLDPKPNIPKPNWRVTYDGLSKLEKVKKYFKSFTLSHAYRSSYNIGGYTSNLLYGERNGGAFERESVSSISTNPNFLPKDLINTVTISEQYSPLIKLEMTMNNSVLLSFEYKKDRNLSLGLTSKTITEMNGREIIGGIGYRLREVKLPKRFQIKGKPIKSDLNLKADISFRKNETIMRRIVEEVSQSTGGTNIISIKVSADYVISDKINIRLFYDRIINKPVISTSFPTTNTNAGVSLRLTLSN
ncbi:MAG: cell surface protein SprA, partial [Bacteroidetes bacterium]|nr:cell surface protein SprA [Bacteroidota bacterium]